MSIPCDAEDYPLTTVQVISSRALDFHHGHKSCSVKEYKERVPPKSLNVLFFFTADYKENLSDNMWHMAKFNYFLFV